MDETPTVNTSPDPRDTFERLLNAMPRMAEAVNAFSSEKNQRGALDALVRAIGIPPVSVAAVTAPVSSSPPAPSVAPISIPTPDFGAGDGANGDEPVSVNGSEAPAPVAKTMPRRRRTTRKWDPVRDINFRPEGKQAFKDLVKEKEPATNDQKTALAVWWLEQVAEIQEVGVGQVLAAYKECEWREPAQPDTSLRATASRTHWIDTGNMKAIATTPSGRNVVQHDMPIKKASKKS